jgi:trans-aconitate methyltransferase
MPSPILGAMTDWRAFHEATAGRSPRPLFVRAMKVLGPGAGRTAVDLGFGDGTETKALLARGWSVHAVDAEPTAAERLRADVPEHQKHELRIVTARLEDVRPPRADFIYAGLSLPFCAPERFPGLWQRITLALRPDGVFAGHLFGDRDSWAADPSMTFMSLDQATALLSDLTTLFFEEQDEDGDSFAGRKHWHVFHVIAAIAHSGS